MGESSQGMCARSASRRRCRGVSCHGLICLALLCAIASGARADTVSLASAQSLKQLSLEELMNVEVMMVSRQVERLGDAPAAIAVVTNEELRRSGATTLPDALRHVPGLHVGQRDSNTWGVSARGFSSMNSEKLLVLNDGRSLYTPLYSGVYWDVQNVILQDVERIEVVRGPGAALWGSNAVNGVLNIVSKHSRDTQGTYFEALSGSTESVLANARYGGTLGERGTFRVHGSYREREATYHPTIESDDGWSLGQIGFRGDWDLANGDVISLHSAAYQADIGQTQAAITLAGRNNPSGHLVSHASGGHVLAHWLRELDGDTQLRARLYYDRTRRDDPSYFDRLETLDADWQHSFTWRARHRVLWGLNLRQTDSVSTGKGIFNLDPDRSVDYVISGFIQDRIRLSEATELTVGTKLEDNDFSALEWQPSIRIAWVPSVDTTVWAAISRAVRVPTRMERDLAIDASEPNADPQFRLNGNHSFASEQLLAYELGYRVALSQAMSMDLTGFYNRYAKLAALEIGTPFTDSGGTRTIVPVQTENANEGHGYGVEALMSYTPNEHWRLVASYAFLELNLRATGIDANRSVYFDGATPRHMVGLRSLLDISNALQFDVHLRYLSEIRRSPEISSGEGIQGYTTLDMRLAWAVSAQLELSLVGQNLLERRHLEVGSPSARGYIERGVYAKASWGF